MQSAKGNSKKSVAQVKKPILKGSWHGKDAWKLALKRMLSMLAVTVIYLIAGMLLSFCLLYTSPSPRDRQKSRMPSSA